MLDGVLPSSRKNNKTQTTCKHSDLDQHNSKVTAPTKGLPTMQCTEFQKRNLVKYRALSPWQLHIGRNGK